MSLISEADRGAADSGPRPRCRPGLCAKTLGARQVDPMECAEGAAQPRSSAGCEEHQQARLAPPADTQATAHLSAPAVGLVRQVALQRGAEGAQLPLVRLSDIHRQHKNNYRKRRPILPILQ